MRLWRWSFGVLSQTVIRGALSTAERFAGIDGLVAERTLRNSLVLDVQWMNGRSGRKVNLYGFCQQ